MRREQNSNKPVVNIRLVWFQLSVHEHFEEEIAALKQIFTYYLALIYNTVKSNHCYNEPVFRSFSCTE